MGSNFELSHQWSQKSVNQKWSLFIMQGSTSSRVYYSSRFFNPIQSPPSPLEFKCFNGGGREHQRERERERERSIPRSGSLSSSCTCAAPVLASVFNHYRPLCLQYVRGNQVCEQGSNCLWTVFRLQVQRAANTTERTDRMLC